MTKLKKGLGKGLDALFSSSNVSLDILTSTTDKADGMVINVDKPVNNSGLIVENIALYNIKAGKYQPRKVFNEQELEELAESIRHNGVIQPVVVRKHGLLYELVAGERRFRACKLLGLKHIPAILREFSDDELLMLGLIENIQRKDLNVIEEANGYKRLVDEFGITHAKLAQVTGKSRSHITNLLRLLNLSLMVQDMLLKNKLDMGHARALLSLDEPDQQALANIVVEQNITTAKLEDLVSELKAGNRDCLNLAVQNPISMISQHQSSAMVKPLSNIKYKGYSLPELEQRIKDKLGVKQAKFSSSQDGGGKLTISYKDNDEFNLLLEQLVVDQ